MKFYKHIEQEVKVVGIGVLDWFCDITDLLFGTPQIEEDELVEYVHDVCGLVNRRTIKMVLDAEMRFLEEKGIAK